MARRFKAAPEVTSSVQYAGFWMERLRELVPTAITDPTEAAVHDARVATRRLKAALDIAGPQVGQHEQKVLQKVLRTLRRRLGPMRDAEVMLEHLTELAEGRFKPGADWLIDRVKADLATAKRKTRKKIDPADALSKLGKWWGIQQAWSASLAEVDRRITTALHTQLDEFSRRAHAVFSAESTPTEERDPHALRIAGKSLRYTVEIATAAGHPLPAVVGRVFKKMQDALGLWHDYVLLAEYALRESVDDDLVLHNTDMQTQVLELVQAVITRAGRQLEQFHTLWQRSGVDLTDRLRAAVPMEPVTQTETGPGLFDSTSPGSATGAAPEIDPAVS